MGVIESVKKGFGTAAQSMNLVLALFIFGFAWNALNIFIAPAPDVEPTPVQITTMIVAGLFFILATIFIQAGSLGFVRDKIKQGQAGFANFTDAGKKYYVRLLAIGAVIALIVAVFLVLASLPMAMMAAETVNIIAVILTSLIVLGGLYVVILFFLAPYIVVANDERAVPALKASTRFVKDNMMAIAGIFVLLILLGFIFGLVIGLIFALISMAGLPDMPAQLIFAALSSFVNAFLGLVVSASFMNYYLANRQTATSNT